MALSTELENAGLTAESISIKAAVTLKKIDDGFAIPKIHLDTTAKISGADRQTVETAANNAKTGCPVSQLLNAQITLDAILEA